MQTTHRSHVSGGSQAGAPREEPQATGTALQIGTLYSTPWSLALKRRDIVRIKCVSGRLWITQEGQLTDIILQPGQVSEVTGPGLLLVSGLPSGSFCLATS